MEPDANLVDLDMRSRPIAEALLPPVLSLAALTNPRLRRTRVILLA